MKPPGIKNELAERLQQEILSLQGCRAPTGNERVHFGLGALESSFPGGVLPTGAVHELLSVTQEEAAATTGFLAGLLGKIMHGGGVALWIGHERTLFPPALKFFGVEPDRVLFVEVRKERDLLWMVEEALKCRALAAVVGELREVDLAGSRRLQLAVEQSRVTGFLHRRGVLNRNMSAAAVRWRITPGASGIEGGLPGIGFYRWQVELLKVRNGQPGAWELEWRAGNFKEAASSVPVQAEPSEQKIA